MSVFRWQLLENKSSVPRHCIFVPSVYGPMKYIGNFKTIVGSWKWKDLDRLISSKGKPWHFFCIIFSFVKSRKCATKVFSLNVTFFSWKKHYQLCRGQHQLCVSLNIHWHLAGRNMSVAHDENISLIWISKPQKKLHSSKLHVCMPCSHLFYELLKHCLTIICQSSRSGNKQKDNLGNNYFAMNSAGWHLWKKCYMI